MSLLAALLRVNVIFWNSLDEFISVMHLSHGFASTASLLSRYPPWQV